MPTYTIGAPKLLGIGRRPVKWVLFGVLGLAASYAVLFGVVLTAMLQPPARFGQFMKRVPEALVWGALPASHMWLWARSGDLVPGVQAPDLTLPRHGDSGRVTLSSYRGNRAVVLVFGSYS
jgi:hypothetical protein